MEEAVAHCSSKDSSAEGAGNGSSEVGAATGTSKSDMPEGETIAYNELGQPSIVRHVDNETGVARTIVKNEDGSHRVFGENTVTSLTNSTAEEASTWAYNLTNHQLRGLVHEVGQRLLKDSQLYHTRLTELDKMGEIINYQYFGLNVGDSEKNLDNAYRKLARSMHPDKNGGTEEAKKKFQNMKARYEALKKKRGESCVDEVPGTNQNKKEVEGEKSSDKNNKDNAKTQNDDLLTDPTEEGADDEAPKHEEAEEDEASEDKTEDKSSTKIEYDPGNKESMVATVARMVKQLQNVDIQMQVLMKELQKARTQLPSKSPEN